MIPRPPDVVTLDEAMAAVDAALDGNQTALDGKALPLCDGRTVRLGDLTKGELRREVDLFGLGLDVQKVALDAVRQFIDEMRAFFGDLEDEAYWLLNVFIAREWPAGEPHPTATLSDGRVVLDPKFLAARWAEVSTEERIQWRSRLEIEHRVGPRWREFSATALGAFADFLGDDLDVDPNNMAVWLLLWDWLDEPARSLLVNAWQKAETEGPS